MDNLITSPFITNQTTIIMEIRRATDALLRTQISPFACLFNPTSTTTRWQAGQHFNKTKPSHRSFTNSCKKSAVRQPTSITTSAAPPPPDPNSSSTSNDTLNDLTKDLGWGSATGIQLPPRFNIQSPKQTSSDDLLQAFQKTHAQKVTSAHRQASSFDVKSMLNPYDSSKTLNSDTVSSEVDRVPTPPRVPLHLNPALGRTAYVTTRSDLTKTILAVERLCARNKVRTDFTAQRYHERPGLKRKRLRSVRWRKNFRASFNATVARVTELTKQGW